MRNTRTKTALGGVAFALVALTLGACGADGADPTDTASAEADGAESTSPAAATGTDDEFCGLARSWQVHELVEPDHEDPVAFAAYWAEYVVFVEASHAVAPDEIAGTWDTYAAIVAGMTDVFERYEFNGERFEAESTPEEQETIEPTDAESLAVNEAVLAFERERCATIQPAAAEVSFADEQAGAYCDAIEAESVILDEVAASDFDPEVVEAAATEFDTRGEALLASAPEVIRADVEALTVWDDVRQRPVFEDYGFDFRRILLEASDAELADFNRIPPEIRDHFARTLAYEEQVCGA